MSNKLLYKESSEDPATPFIRLKIEINCREHFHVMPWKLHPFVVENTWFSQACNITTYQLDELLGTKLRALYQRSKGRDLFDLHQALTRTQVNADPFCGRSCAIRIFLQNMFPVARNMN